jgi:hypothetical protein
VEKISSLSKDASPVDGIDGSEVEVGVDFWIREESLDSILNV